MNLKQGILFFNALIAAITLVILFAACATHQKEVVSGITLKGK